MSWYQKTTSKKPKASTSKCLWNKHSKFPHSQQSNLKSQISLISISNHFDFPALIHQSGSCAPGSWVVRMPVAPDIIAVEQTFKASKRPSRKHLPFDTFENPPPRKNEHWRKVPKRKKNNLEKSLVVVTLFVCHMILPRGSQFSSPPFTAAAFASRSMEDNRDAKWDVWSSKTMPGNCCYRKWGWNQMAM